MLRANKLLLAFLSVTLVSILVLGSGTLFAAEKKEAAKPEKKVKSVSAMKVGKDPENTLRKVTKDEDKVLSERLRQTLDQYPKHEAKTRSDGTKSLVITPQFLNFNVATVGPDGKITYSCNKVTKKNVDTKQNQSKSQPEE